MSKSEFPLQDFERYPWARLRASVSAIGVPTAIHRLATAETQEEADSAYWRIDNVVILQGCLYEAVVPTVTCVILALPLATPIGRVQMIEFLSQVANGFWVKEELAHVPPDWPDRCRSELLRGASFYLELLPTASPDELQWCVDLLTYCAVWDPKLRQAVSSHFSELLQKDQGKLRDFIEKCANKIRFLDVPR